MWHVWLEYSLVICRLRRNLRVLREMGVQKGRFTTNRCSVQVVWIARRRHIGDAFFDADAAQFLREQLQASREKQVRSCVMCTIVGTTFAICLCQSHQSVSVLQSYPCGHSCWYSKVYTGLWCIQDGGSDAQNGVTEAATETLSLPAIGIAPQTRASEKCMEDNIRQVNTLTKRRC